MKQSSPSVAQLGSAIVGFIKRHHIIIFTLTVVTGVSVAVLLLNNLLVLSNTPGSTPSNGFVFDQETINQIETFNSPSEEDGELSLPDGRYNPFVE